MHPAPLPEVIDKLEPDVKSKIGELLRKVTVLDPCSGSGVFIVSVLQGLRRAGQRLGERLGWQAMETIIKEQLCAVDIHPLAVLITRLRLFIALIDKGSGDGQGMSTVPPLPNLETSCIAADTLCVDLAGQQTIRSGVLDRGIEELREARKEWTSAHDSQSKRNAMERERQARTWLRDKDPIPPPPGRDQWYDVSLLSSSAGPAKHDIRALFPAPKGGWDIIIGNPPYQKPDPSEKTQGKALGYRGATANLYLMFLESALEVSKAGGCVTLIVPHSIIFRRDGAFREVRRRIDGAASRVDIRTFDNGPQPAFPKLPWLKGKGTNANRQRVTIIRILKRASLREGALLEVYSRGLHRIKAAQRTSIIQTRGDGQLQPRLEQRWSQAPTRELAELLRIMHAKVPRRKESAGQEITYPQSAMYFITCLPAQAIRNRSRKTTFLRDDKYYWPWIGLYNSHLFHAYWLMIGDAYHVTGQNLLSVNAPPGWEDENIRSRTEAAARQFVDPALLDACRTEFRRGEKVFPNCDFHSNAEGAKTIAELDHLLLRAYELPASPLLAQMRTIRTGSAHEIEN